MATDFFNVEADINTSQVSVVKSNDSIQDSGDCSDVGRKCSGNRCDGGLKGSGDLSNEGGDAVE